MIPRQQGGGGSRVIEVRPCAVARLDELTARVGATVEFAGVLFKVSELAEQDVLLKLANVLRGRQLL